MCVRCFSTETVLRRGWNSFTIVYSNFRRDRHTPGRVCAPLRSATTLGMKISTDNAQCPHVRAEHNRYIPTAKSEEESTSIWTERPEHSYYFPGCVGWRSRPGAQGGGSRVTAGSARSRLDQGRSRVGGDGAPCGRSRRQAPPGGILLSGRPCRPPTHPHAHPA